VSSVGLDPAERVALIQEIAVLDQRFQARDMAEADYRAQREKLIGRVLQPGAQPNGEPQGEPDVEQRE